MKQDKKVKKEMKNLMQFEDQTIAEMERLIESVLRAVYSTAAYDTAKEIMETKRGD